MTDKYKLKYKIDVFNDPKGYSKDDPDFNEETDSMTDSLILGSILHAPDGGVSHMFVSCDENQEPIKAHNFFMAWASLAYSLTDYPDMSEQHKQILTDTHEAVRAMVLNNRGILEEKDLEREKLDTDPYLIKGKFMLDEDNNVIPAKSLSEWGEWFGDPLYRPTRIVSQTFITPDIWVSTVFLALDHGFPELPELEGRPASEYKPELWETMVFGGELDDDQERYTSREDAIKGHLAMVDAVRATLK